MYMYTYIKAYVHIHTSLSANLKAAGAEEGLVEQLRAIRQPHHQEILRLFSG